MADYGKAALSQIGGLSKETQKRNPIPISDRNNAYNQFLSDGVDTNVTYRVKHKAYYDTFDIRLVFSNFYLNRSDTDGVNDITIKAAIEINTVFYAATFNGSKTITLKPGQIVVSDPIGINIAKDTDFYTRTNVSVASAGQKWPLGNTIRGGSFGEGKTTGDIVMSGTPSYTTGFSYSPMAVLGSTTTYKPAVLIVGDSIASGQGDTQELGFIVRALDSAKIPWMRVSMPGEASYGFKGLGRMYRAFMCKYATHAIIQYGVNDLNSFRTYEQFKADLQDIWNFLNQRGLKLYQTTLTPKTTSTDGWTTTANQTLATPLESWGTDPATSVRYRINEFIRTIPAPLNGVFDVTLKVETAKNSGIWLPNMVGDGVHPNSNGAIALSTGVDVSLLNS